MTPKRRDHRKKKATSSATKSKLSRTPAGLLPFPVTGADYTGYLYNTPISQADERSSVDGIDFPGYDGVEKQRRRSLSAAYPDYVAGGDPKPNPPRRYVIYAPKQSSAEQINFPGYDGVAPLQLVGTTTIEFTCDSKQGSASYHANPVPVPQPDRELSLSKRLAKDKSVCIPEDILFEVLVRLPIKPLIQFTIVCKRWRALIRGRHFITEHRRRSGIVLLIGPEITEHSVYIHRPENVYTEEESSCAIVQEDGLVGIVQERSENFWIWNPSTRSCVAIPYRADHEYGTSAGLASDGEVYTIIRIVCSPIPTTSVFNLNSANWVDIIGTLPCVPVGSTCDAIVSGVPFWLLTNSKLASFDINLMSFTVEELGWPEDENAFCFGEIEAGTLGALVYPLIPPVMFVEVFARETGGRWVHRYLLEYEKEMEGSTLIGFYCRKDKEYVQWSAINNHDAWSNEIIRLYNEEKEEVITEFEDGDWGRTSKLVNVKESMAEPPRVGVQD